MYMKVQIKYVFFFFFKDPAPTEFSPLSLHDALPIWRFAGRRGAYGTVELRLLGGRLPLGDVGIWGLADVGGVWIPAESSDRWHAAAGGGLWLAWQQDRKSTRLNSSHGYISYAVLCLK